MNNYATDRLVKISVEEIVYVEQMSPPILSTFVGYDSDIVPVWAVSAVNYKS